MMRAYTKIPLAFALVLAACGSDGEDAPTDISTTGDDSSGTNPQTSLTTLDTTVTDADTTIGESSSGESGTDDTTTTGGPECLGENDCWQCDPNSSTQLLNQCTDAECSPFDNVARLPLLERDGSLPPLP
ncbi:MAG: hypothetical protein IAG13_04845 [Deltaproteobacteria bacterium]|nr:hypothetical protein [Nannocystaceae bacterium]